MEVIIKEAGNRLDKALADLTELSRSQANEAIKAGTVLVNGKSAKAKYAGKEGDVITYELPEEEVLEYKAEDIPLDIIYLNKDKKVVSIAKNARPKDETSLPSEAPAMYVLEINGGLADKWGIEKGDRVEISKLEN